MSFFDKMREKVAPALSDATQKLKQGVEHMGDKLTETRLRGELKTLQKERDEKLQVLGLKVYVLHQGDGIGLDDLTTELQDVEAAQNRMNLKQDEIDAFLKAEGKGEAPPPPPEQQNQNPFE